jgi:TatD DNase family protein
VTAPRLVDTHAHVMDAAFDADRDAVLVRARQSGVSALVLVGYDVQTSRGAVELAARIPNAVATVGIHPNSAGQASAADFATIADLARNNPHVVGIGETGLDYYRHHTPPARQREAFAWHLELANELGKPVIVHNRQADADVAGFFQTRAYGPPGILHCFSSSDEAYLRSMLDAGFCVSFAGPLTFRNATTTRAMAALVPLDRLLVETDCPYLAPEPHRGRRNEPAYVRDTAACLAEVRGLSLERLAEQLWSNSVRVFPALAELSTEAAA